MLATRRRGAQNVDLGIRLINTGSVALCSETRDYTAAEAERWMGEGGEEEEGRLGVKARGRRGFLKMNNLGEAGPVPFIS